MTGSADWDCTYHYYQDGRRVIEVRDGSDWVMSEQVWGLGYVDEQAASVINQDYASKLESSPGKCERFFFVMQDANYNVLGAASGSGMLTERYEQTLHG